MAGHLMTGVLLLLNVSTTLIMIVAPVLLLRDPLKEEGGVVRRS